ncbi:hypothetical protein BDBG_17623 [Blastomyces gilchristii SLH14081]|uniref:Uncharacterized protein n=1 Tax=Blastomyces gilchristii (strain SLH14081) TaxID=559298 RepID=A0A179UWC4_BLAGS|nr:uncharacterized protein BDBG_17623 [Blastomyces gilchristii SLH14081]OAT12113.1 hypothetical protein BDBG_17623 [Blastomyces gilchristii SLH14081]
MLSYFVKVGSVTISAPLSKDILPKDGYVEEDITQSSVHLWKRGAGDKLHPRLWPMRPGNPGEGQIYSGTVRYVHALVLPRWKLLTSYDII